MKTLAATLILALSVFSSLICVGQSRPFSIEGHRGARGHLPENTIPSFVKALELGADTLELDVVISKDNKVVVSHEAWFSYLISLDPQGHRIAKEKERENNIFLMPYSEIRLYDVGSLGNPAFPMQQPLRSYKPLLSEVFAEVDRLAKQKRLALPRYNIEIKSAPDGDGKFHPAPEEFARLTLDVIRKFKMEQRVKVQSFDVRPLQVLHRIAPRLDIALLVGNKDGVEASIGRLGFIPSAYSPHFSLVDQATVEYCVRNKIKLIPWTVNELSDLERIKTFKIDGVITDFPDRAVTVFRK